MTAKVASLACVSLMLLLAGGTGSALAQSGPGAPLTLDQAVATALSGDHQLKAADATAAAAGAILVEARGARLPKIELSEVYSRTTNPVYVFGGLLGQEAFGPADFDPAFLNQPPPLNNFNTKVSLTEPIYAGGRIQSGVAAAQYAQQAAGADRERTRQQIIHQVVEAYSGAILAAAHLHVVDEALATAKAHVKLVSDMRAAGLVVDSDVLQAQVQQSEVEEMAARARSTAAVSRAGLNLVMGVELDRPVGLPEAIEPPPSSGESLDDLSRAALARRRDLDAMDKRVAAAGQMVQAARGAARPEVGVTGQYEANKEDFVGADGSNWSVFVAARLPLYSGGALRARVARAREEQQAAAQMNELLRQRVGLEVRQAWYDLDAARQRLALAAASVAQARAALSIVEDRYKEGLTNIVELMSAQTTLTAARTREVAARRDVLLGQATLDLAVGRL